MPIGAARLTAELTVAVLCLLATRRCMTVKGMAETVDLGERIALNSMCLASPTRSNTASSPCSSGLTRTFGRFCGSLSPRGYLEGELMLGPGFAADCSFCSVRRFLAIDMLRYHASSKGRWAIGTELRPSLALTPTASHKMRSVGASQEGDARSTSPNGPAVGSARRTHQDMESSGRDVIHAQTVVAVLVCLEQRAFVNLRNIDLPALTGDTGPSQPHGFTVFHPATLSVAVGPSLSAEDDIFCCIRSRRRVRGRQGSDSALERDLGHCWLG